MKNKQLKECKHVYSIGPFWDGKILHKICGICGHVYKREITDPIARAACDSVSIAIVNQIT